MQCKLPRNRDQSRVSHSRFRRRSSKFRPNGLVSPDGAKRCVRGSSVGGGSILITKIDQFAVDFTGENHALVVSYKDQPGIIAKITSLLAAENVNIAAMRVSRKAKHSKALAIIELDQPAPEKSIAKISQIPSVDTVMVLPPILLEEGA